MSENGDLFVTDSPTHDTVGSSQLAQPCRHGCCTCAGAVRCAVCAWLACSSLLFLFTAQLPKNSNLRADMQRIAACWLCCWKLTRLCGHKCRLTQRGQNSSACQLTCNRSATPQTLLFLSHFCHSQAPMYVIGLLSLGNNLFLVPTLRPTVEHMAAFT